MPTFAESTVEEAALAWLDGLGYTVLHGPDIAVGEPGAERRQIGGASHAGSRAATWRTSSPCSLGSTE